MTKSSHSASAAPAPQAPAPHESPLSESRLAAVVEAAYLLDAVRR